MLTKKQIKLLLKNGWEWEDGDEDDMYPKTFYKRGWNIVFHEDEINHMREDGTNFVSFKDFETFTEYVNIKY